MPVLKLTSIWSNYVLYNFKQRKYIFKRGLYFQSEYYNQNVWVVPSTKSTKQKCRGRWGWVSDGVNSMEVLNPF